MSDAAANWIWVSAAIAVIAGLGIYGIVARRNLFRMLMGFTMLTKAVTLAFVYGGAYWMNPGLGQSLAIIIIVIEAAVTAVGMSMIVNIYRHYGAVDTSQIKRLRG
ncbi:MAG: NADH-quinone oxidoreductase subunit K [Firmicutes bacterium]|jgi:NADH:ubiquinone oxidoreductase subunit K|nr:NADH-quinone oxidoreductase subunit K [Bacillota bacterium]HPU00527.1 NADH-quinone oxidoreductase subunit K [Bacillota bacterium]